jgi:Fe-S-cluster-containing dehydrogenase component
MTVKWNLIVDVARCENCNNCSLAVKDEHVGNDFPGYAASQPLHEADWLVLRKKERGQAPVVEVHSMPVTCNHCDNAPCVKAARNEAVYQRADGIVIIDPEKAVGQRQLVEACPYHAIRWNEQLQLPQKWIFDAHLLDAGWQRTRIEQVCGTGALKTLKISDEAMGDLARQDGLEVLHPEWGTRPRVYYKNLHLMTKVFVAGTAVTQVNGREECLPEAQVSLQCGERVLGVGLTDSFGEFKLDGLEPDGSECRVRVQHQGRHVESAPLRLDESRYLGVFNL